MPKIDEQSKNYQDLCESLVPQEDYFVAQLQDISEQFHGHTLTKLSKKLKQENMQLEKAKKELQEQVSQLTDLNKQQKLEIYNLNQQVDSMNRTSQLQQIHIDKLKQDIEYIKQQQFDGYTINATQHLNPPQINIRNSFSSMANNNMILASPRQFPYMNNVSRPGSSLSLGSPNSPIKHSTKHSSQKQNIFASNNIDNNYTGITSLNSNRLLKTEDSSDNLPINGNQTVSQLNQNNIVYEQASNGTVKYDHIQQEKRIRDLEQENERLMRDLNEERLLSEEITNIKEMQSYELMQLRENNQELLEQLEMQALKHTDTVRQLEQDMKELQLSLTVKQNDMYRQPQSHQPDNNETQKLKTQILEQDAKHLELVRQHSELEQEWQNMEKYIRELNGYQNHVEEKYNLLLEQFQTLVIENQKIKLERQSKQTEFESQQQQNKSVDQSPKISNNGNSPINNNQNSNKDTLQDRNVDKEKETLYLNMINMKDEEIKRLKEDLKKQEHIITEQSFSISQTPIQLNESQMQQDNIEKLNGLQESYNQMEDMYQLEIFQKDQQIQQLESVIRQLEINQSQNQQTPNEDEINELIQILEKRDQEIIELNKDKEINQKLIVQLEKQINDLEKKLNKAQGNLALNQQKTQYQIEIYQKQLEDKENEYNEYRKQMDQVEKDLQNQEEQTQMLLDQNKQFKQKIQEYENKIINLTNYKNQQQYTDSEQDQDRKEIEYYLNEVKQIKERIIENLVLCKQNISTQKQSSRKNETFDMKFQNLKELPNIRTIVFLFKNFVRKELEHLIILNSHSLELQEITYQKLQDQPQNQNNPHYEKPLIEKLSEIIQIDNENDYNLEQAIDITISSFKQLFEDNKQLLLKIDILANEGQLQSEYDNICQQNQQLLTELKLAKQDELSKILQLETQMIQKQIEEQDQNKRLADENNELHYTNQKLQQDLSQFQSEFIHAKERNKQLERKNDLLKQQLNEKDQLDLSIISKQSTLPKYKESTTKTVQIAMFEETDSIDNYNKRQSDNFQFKINPLQRSLKLPTEPQSNKSSIVNSQMNSYREQESGKLNLLMEEYRQENDKCAKKIQSLQQKLSMTQNSFTSQNNDLTKKSSITPRLIQNDSNQNSFRNDTKYELASTKNNNNISQYQKYYQNYQRQYQSYKQIPQNFTSGNSPPNAMNNLQNKRKTLKNDQIPSIVINDAPVHYQTQLFSKKQEIKPQNYTTLRHGSFIASNQDNSKERFQQEQNEFSLGNKSNDFQESSSQSEYFQFDNPNEVHHSKLKAKPSTSQGNYNANDVNNYRNWQLQQIQGGHDSLNMSGFSQAIKSSEKMQIDNNNYSARNTHNQFIPKNYNHFKSTISSVSDAQSNYSQQNINNTVYNSYLNGKNVNSDLSMSFLSQNEQPQIMGSFDKRSATQLQLGSNVSYEQQRYQQQIGSIQIQNLFNGSTSNSNTAPQTAEFTNNHSNSKKNTIQSANYNKNSPNYGNKFNQSFSVNIQESPTKQNTPLQSAKQYYGANTNANHFKNKSTNFNFTQQPKTQHGNNTSRLQ